MGAVFMIAPRKRNFRGFAPAISAPLSARKSDKTVFGVPSERAFGIKETVENPELCYSAATTASRTAVISAVGSNRARTVPSRPIKNFVKFHLM